MSALLFLLGMAALMVAMVGAPLYLVYLVSSWWHSPERVAARETRRCLGCGEHYHQDWDPPNFSRKRALADDSWMSGGLCPDCSGAD